MAKPERPRKEIPIPEPDQLGNMARKAEGDTRKLFAKLKKSRPASLDETMRLLHEETFSHVDCLNCANCCKTTSPIFTDKDIERLSRLFKMKSVQFIEKHLHLDRDKDYVLNGAP